MSDENAHPQLERYLAALERRDLQAASDVAFGMLDAGSTMGEIFGLLRQAQREVGRRWQVNAWTVADEHAATSLTDRVAAAVSSASRSPAVHPHVTLACAEGEWHALPARLVADELGALGWDVRFLGSSVPARHLQDHLERERPLALIVSCTVPLFLPGAEQTVRAAHQAGIPALAGGRAFGEGSRRAEAVGADGWAADADQASEVLRDWMVRDVRPEGLADVEGLALQRRVRAYRDTIVDDAERALLARWPDLAAYDAEQRARTREDLHYLLGFLEAACLTGDDRVLGDYLTWLEEVLSSRGVPARVLDPTIDAVRQGLQAHGLDNAAAVLERGTAATSAGDAAPGPSSSPKEGR